MPFLSEEELTARLNSPDNLKNKVDTLFLEPLIPVGPKQDKPQTPIAIRKVIAALVSDPERKETQASIGKVFDLNQPQVSNISRGLSSRPDSLKIENPELKRIVDKNQARRETAETKAIDVLLTTLDILPSKISNSTSVKTLTAAAKGMAEVADKMSNRKSIQELNQQVHLHIFVPKQKDVEDYDVIDV